MLVLSGRVLTSQVNIRAKIKVPPGQGVLRLIWRQRATLGEPHVFLFCNALSLVKIYSCAPTSLRKVHACHCLRVLGGALTVTFFHAILVQLLRYFRRFCRVKQRLQLHSLIEFLIDYRVHCFAIGIERGSY